MPGQGAPILEAGDRVRCAALYRVTLPDCGGWTSGGLNQVGAALGNGARRNASGGLTKAWSPDRKFWVREGRSTEDSSQVGFLTLGHSEQKGP